MADANSDPTHSTPSSNGNGNGRRKTNRILLILLVVVIIGIIGYTIYWLLVGRWHVTTDDAYVQGNMISLTSQVSGTVVDVNAALTQYVKRGTVVVRLDDTDAKIALARAEADLAQTVRSTAQLFQTAAGDAVLVSKRRVLLGNARSDLARDRKLAPVNGVSRQALEHAEVKYKGAQADLEQAQHQLAAARAATANTSIEDHPQVKQAEADVRKAWVMLARTRILAPTSGYIAQKNVQVGEQAAPGRPLLAIVPLRDAYVDANFKEDQLSAMRIGQPVALTSDLYGSDVTYHGKVIGFSSGTGAAFSVLPPQNATGNWVKVVQRLPVRIGLDPKDLAKHPLMLGMSMQVDVSIHDVSGQMLTQTPAFDGATRTDVYTRQTQGVDAAIAGIVRDNLPDADTRSALTPPQPDHGLKLSMHVDTPAPQTATIGIASAR